MKNIKYWALLYFCVKLATDLPYAFAMKFYSVRTAFHMRRERPKQSPHRPMMSFILLCSVLSFTSTLEQFVAASVSLC